MMRIVMTAVFVLSMGCPSWAGEVEATGKGGLAFYFLGDPEIPSSYITDASLNEVELQPHPFFTSRELIAYDFSGHVLEVTTDGYKQLTSPLKELRGHLVSGVPFVVCADGHRCYIGTYKSSFSSIPYEGPCIFDWSYLDASNNVSRVLIEGGYPDLQGRDARDDSRIADILKREGLYHEGLAARVTEAHFTEWHNDKGESGSTLHFVYEINNRDSRALYVPDSDKASGTCVFRRFDSRAWTNADALAEWNLTLGCLTPGYQYQTAEEARQRLKALTEIPPGETIRRSAEVSGFPADIPIESTITVWLSVKPWSVRTLLEPLSAEEINAASPLLHKIWWGDLRMEAVSPKRK